MERRNFFSVIGTVSFLASSMGMARASSMGKIDSRMQELGITLPDAPKPIAAYRPFRISGNLVYIAGQGPIHSAEHPGLGRVGKDLTTEQGYQAARTTGLNPAYLTGFWCYPEFLFITNVITLILPKRKKQGVFCVRGLGLFYIFSASHCRAPFVADQLSLF